MTKKFLTAFSVVLVLNVAIAATSLFAQDAPAIPAVPAPTQAATQATTAVPAAVPTGSTGEEFKIPENATPAQLAEFAQKLLGTKRQFEKEEDFKAWLNRLFATVLEVTNKILSADCDEQTFIAACGMKGQVLAHLASTEKQYVDSLDDFVKAMEGAERVQQNKEGKLICLSFKGIVYQDRIANIVRDGGTLDELKAQLVQVQQYIVKNPDMSDIVLDLVYPLTVFSETQKKPEILIETLTEFHTILKGSQEKSHQLIARAIEGTLRGLNLKGQQMPIWGIMPDGKPFDQKQYQGKVVVVDFWATWCTPCLASLPDLTALYEKYHDKGLEIIGYNVDQEASVFKQFYEQKKSLWPMIVQSMETTSDEQQNVADYYGITSIPTLILIGRDGNVIDQDLDIDELKQKLDEMFK